MSLSCSCGCDYEPDPGDWAYDIYYGDDLDFEPLKTSKRKRCCSCKSLINIQSLCIKFERSRYPYDDIESKIKTGMCIDDALCNGEPTIKIADHYLCEKCGEIYLNLTAIGYECLSPSENMDAALKEYHAISGFMPKSQPKCNNNETDQKNEQQRLQVAITWSYRRII